MIKSFQIERKLNISFLPDNSSTEVNADKEEVRVDNGAILLEEVCHVGALFVIGSLRQNDEIVHLQTQNSVEKKRSVKDQRWQQNKDSQWFMLCIWVSYHPMLQI